MRRANNVTIQSALVVNFAPLGHLLHSLLDIEITQRNRVANGNCTDGFMGRDPIHVTHIDKRYMGSKLRVGKNFVMLRCME